MMLSRSLVHFSSNSIGARSISLSSTNNLIQKWRKEKGLPLNPNAHGNLTDGQDYTYLDGRPTPYGVGQMKRISKQRELAESIIRLTREVDFAVERHKELKKAEEQQRMKILSSKLKPKGSALLKAKNEV
ncbi:39S ribosomal protein L52, mitochondrial [Coccinella septempunctata]|uniref:39S ribosomal protein L52, mitochondrial n=1 Tax=Coccinella septempunctata TaxID=41139 RepID=UPI001D08D134|nr:39S ribosomal protein L52, mitochondrial [Coccinella septempunctata]